jgi:hypothetical protein
VGFMVDKVAMLSMQNSVSKYFDKIYNQITQRILIYMCENENV